MEKENVSALPIGIFDSEYLISLFDSKSVYREINKLIKNNTIVRIGRNQYVASNKTEYEYKPSDNCLKIEKYISSHFPELDFQIGEVYQLNWFANHQISKNVIIVETEKMLTDSVFYALKDKYQVLLKPAMKDLANYVDNGTIILQNLVSGAPKSKTNHIFTLEKLLIDIVCDKKYMSFIEKAELQHIYETAFASYNINRAAMLRYAGRRSCKEEITKLIGNI